MKGVAVPHIIAIILGIIVIGLIGFWVFKGGIKFGSEVSTSDCNSKALVYCSEWQSTDFDSSKKPDNTDWIDYAPGCSAIGVAANDNACRTLLGISASQTKSTFTQIADSLKGGFV